MTELIAFLILLICGTLSAVAAAAAEAAVMGRVVITKVIREKHVTLPSYDWRGVAIDSEPPDQPAGSDPSVNEFSRGGIYLEGPALKASAPIRSKIALNNRNFEPEIVVVPAVSSVSSPNEDPIFHNVFSLSRVK